MERIDLKKTAERALEQLSAADMSAKALYGYTHTGFGCVIRHFRVKGENFATPEMLDVFVLEQRGLFEQGVISAWKWRLLRRGCELLKYCAENDSVEMPPLPPWEPVLQRPRQSIWKSSLSPEQLADPEDIFTLAWKTNKALTELGLAGGTLQSYRSEGLTVLMRLHYKAGTEHYNEEIIARAIAEKRHQYERGLTERTSYQNLRKAAYLLKEIHREGNITLKKMPNWGQREPKAPFESVLKDFCTSLDDLAESTVRAVKSAARRFLLEMEDGGCTTWKDYTQANINACVTRFARHYAGGLNSALFAVKKFLRYIFQIGRTPVDLSQSLPELAAARKAFHEGFSREETGLLLSQPDRSTAIGKRDYAIMVLAVQSGLRACDMVRLNLDNIDWRSREIRLIQHKTGQPLSLPLEPESGNAIADYILHGRPKRALTNLFLCHSGTDRPLDARTASSVVSKYMRKAGIPAQRRAFHSLRRTFGTGLLRNNVSFELIQQLLGHTDMNSLKPYLSIDEQGLKLCALSLLPYGKDGGRG